MQKKERERKKTDRNEQRKNVCYYFPYFLFDYLSRYKKDSTQHMLAGRQMD